MRKKALLALLMVLTLALTSCSLIVKDEEVDGATEILRLGDQVVTKKEVQSAINYQANYTASLYNSIGYSIDPSDPDFLADIRESVVGTLRQNMVVNAKAAELGFTLTDEEEAQVKADAESELEEDLESSRTYLKSQYPDLDDAGIEAKLMEEVGDLDEVRESYIKTSRETLIRSKVREDVIKDVAVTEDEIQAEFDSKVASDKEKYAENAGSWATAANRGTTTLYYTPAGIRRIRQILIKFTEEDSNALTAANTAVTEAQAKVTEAESKVNDAQAVLDSADATEEEKAQANTDLEAANASLAEMKAALDAANAKVTELTEAAFANIDAAADDVIAQLGAGADWDTLAAEKNEDPGMQAGAVNAEKGYAVAAEGTSFDTAFVEAAMALANPGDVSGKVRSTAGYGYYILKYMGDEAEGPIALEGDVKQSISDTLLSSKQDSFYQDTLAKWVEEAGVKLDMNALK